MIGKPYKKTFVKNPISGTKFTIAISSAKGGVGKSTLSYHLVNSILSEDEDYSYSHKFFQVNQENRSFGIDILKVLVLITIFMHYNVLHCKDN